jgi:hypothetical protein
MFGKMGLWMKQVAYGLDLSEVKEWEEAVKSISSSGTLMKIQMILKNSGLS